MAQQATITFFRFSGRKNQFWAAGQVYHARRVLTKTEGAIFYKILGTGGGKGYKLLPDFRHYAVFILWESEELAKRYESSLIFGHMMEKAVEQYTIYLRPVSSRGSWSGFSNWKPVKSDPKIRNVVALTRATIKPAFLPKFWTMVPKITKSHVVTKGLIFTKGISEVPVLEQATFSVWEDIDSMEDFAYRSFHNEAVFQTRKANGFSEEMFTRFQPVATSGSFLSCDPIFEHDKKSESPNGWENLPDNELIKSKSEIKSKWLRNT